MRRSIFPGWRLPVLLVAPQLLLTFVFFLLPAGEAVWSSLTRTDPFGLSSVFVGLDNFVDLFSDPLYVTASGARSASCSPSACCRWGLALFLAVFADRGNPRARLSTAPC